VCGLFCHAADIVIQALHKQVMRSLGGLRLVSICRGSQSSKHLLRMLYVSCRRTAICWLSCKLCWRIKQPWKRRKQQHR
jgi:hypothetical protein